MGAKRAKKHLILLIFLILTAAWLVLAMRGMFADPVQAADAFGVLADGTVFETDEGSLRADGSQPAGSKQNPYAVRTIEDLKRISDEVNYLRETFEGVFFVAAEDIEGSLYAIGDYVTSEEDSRKFDGTFDGNGKIFTLTVSPMQSRSSTGLFGCIGSDGKVSGLVLDITVNADGMNAGGVAGCNFGTVTDCTVTVDLENIGRNAGGIAGSNHGTIEDCSAEVTAVTAEPVMTLGGICGANYGRIEGCTATGRREEDERAAGLSEEVGGIAGAGYQGSLIAGCESRVGIRMSGEKTGGLCGNLLDGEIRDCVNAAVLESGGRQERTGLLVGGGKGAVIQRVINRSVGSDRIADGTDMAINSVYNINGEEAEGAVNLPQERAVFYQSYEGLDFERVFGYEAGSADPSLRREGRTYKADLQITAEPAQFEYMGAEFVPDAAEFSVSGAGDGEVRILEIFFEGEKVTAMERIGSYLVRLAYAGDAQTNAAYADAECTVTVTDAVQIEAESGLDGLRYYQGEPFDPGDALITVRKEDGSEWRGVCVSASMVSGYDASQIGEQEVVIRVGQAELSVAVEVMADQVENLEMTGTVRREYAVGEAFDGSGAVLTAKYASGKESKVSADDWTVEGFDSSVPGYCAVQIGFGGKEIQFVVHIAEKAVTYMQLVVDGVLRLPQEQTLDLSKLNLCVYYADGMTGQIPVTKEMISGFDSGRIGEQVVSLRYGDRTFEFLVEVVPASSADEPAGGMSGGAIAAICVGAAAAVAACVAAAVIYSRKKKGKMR